MNNLSQRLAEITLTPAARGKDPWRALKITGLRAEMIAKEGEKSVAQTAAEVKEKIVQEIENLE